MPFYRIIKPFLFLFFWCNWVTSQNYPVKNYTAANELPNNAVRSLLLDSKNILWIGTENGVVKKENDEFKYFFEEDGLALNSCWAIEEDKNNNLWFGSYGEGVSIYDGFNFHVISKKDGLVHNEITKLFSFGNKMYVGTSDGVSIIDINSFKVVSLDTPPGNELFRVDGFFDYKNEIYVVTYKNGIFKISYNSSGRALVKVNDRKYIYSIFVDNDSIYSSNKGFFTKSSLADYVKHEDTLSLERLGYSIIWDHVKTRDNKIFAAAWGIYDTNGGIYEVTNDRFISRSSEFNILSKEVFSLAYDHTFEKLYVGTKDSGLFEIALNSQIKFIKIKGNNVLGFANAKNSSALLFNNSIVLKGVEGEHSIPLSQFKKWQQSYFLNTNTPLPQHKDDFYELDYTTKAENIRFYDFKVFQNIYWVNTNVGIFAIEATGELKRYLPLHTEEINFTKEGDLIETNPYGGARVYTDLNSFEYTYFSHKDSHTPTMIVSSLRKENKTYFLSIFSGLFVWENGEFKSYLENGIWKEKKLKHITPLGNNLAISNEFGDVFIVYDDKAFKIFKKIPRAKIQGNTIFFLKEYKEALIIGTEKGLTLYKDNRYIFLDKDQGLNQPLLSAVVDEDTLLIGSNNGYYKIDLNAVSGSKPLVNQINLKEVLINNTAFSLNAMHLEDNLNLAHNQNTVLLKFSTNAHPYPHKLKYQYRLNTKEDWSLTSSKPEIFLPFLPSNNYKIDVKVLDESTGLSYSQSLLNFAILPPFWKTWWFISLLTILFLLGIYSIYHFQIMQTRKFEEQKRSIQKRLEETKMEALLSQMNPHFIFNAMNSIQFYIMANDIDNATIFLGDFAKLIRLNLDHCTKPTLLLVEEIEYLQSYIRVENTRFNNTIDVKIEIDPSIDVYEVEIPTMLLQAFVENVFVHAFPPGIDNPTLKISFKLLAEDILQCTIEDNGIGYSSNSTGKLHKSKGVSLVKERLALLGYDIEEAVKVITSKNEGTSILLTLKV